MIETDLVINLSDGKKIHGSLRGSLTDGSPVVIMMHGRPGSGNELLQYLGAHYLYEQGITSLRLSMYDFGSNYRALLDCTLDTHITDFDTVVTYLRENGVKKLFASGHSYGGITILGSASRLEGAVLWDPSHGLAWQDPEFDSPDFPEETFGNVIVGTGGHGYISSTTQQAYDKGLGDTTEWAKAKGYPMKFILASAGPLAKYAQRYYEVADQPKALIGIEGAHHQFEDSDEIVEQLLSETAEWIKKF
jgi:dienelactone hydrolase